MILGDVLQRRISGAYVVDQSGLDRDLARLAGRILGLGLRIDVDGADRVPDGGALLVHNRLLGPPETFAAVRGIGLATGRPVRFVGVVDLDPLGPALRKLGGVLAHPAEVGALLRDGELVLVGQRRSLRPRSSAAAPERMARAATDAGVPMVPVTVVARPAPGRWRVTVG